MYGWSWGFLPPQVIVTYRVEGNVQANLCRMEKASHTSKKRKKKKETVAIQEEIKLPRTDGSKAAIPCTHAASSASFIPHNCS